MPAGGSVHVQDTSCARDMKRCEQNEAEQEVQLRWRRTFRLVQMLVHTGADVNVKKHAGVGARKLRAAPHVGRDTGSTFVHFHQISHSS